MGNITQPQEVVNHTVALGLCLEMYQAFQKKPELVYCSPVYDGFLCWPPTPAGNVSTQSCPKVRLSDPKNDAFRQCGYDGMWLGKYGENTTNPNGWTNYTPCFPPIVRSLLYKVYDEDETEAQYKFSIADTTRKIEIIGFTLSLFSLTVSLIILNSFKSLRNLRTKIHMNLFAAMNAQVVLRLVLYADQALVRKGSSLAMYTGISAIERLPHLCICVYVLLEFFITVMFMWMLNEGYYLNTLVTTKAMRPNTSYKYFWMIGWLTPVFVTGGWAIAAGFHYGDSTTLECWYGYNFLPVFWMIQGPRLAVILMEAAYVTILAYVGLVSIAAVEVPINFAFLLNIMRVLVLKLQEDDSSDIVKTRKAVKAAMVLLPLLGITNISSMFEGPVAGPVWLFAIWSYCTHFLRSFQGTFLANLYCFGNAEVRAALRKYFSNSVTIFRHRHPTLAKILHLRPQIRRRRSSPGSADGPGGSGGDGARPGDISLKEVKFWTPRSQQHQRVEIDPQTMNVSETDFGGTSTDCYRSPQPGPSGISASHASHHRTGETVVTIEAPPGPRPT